MKSWNSYLIRIISFSVLMVTASLTQALPDECAKLTASATFLETNSLVCLQKIIVTDSSGDQLYKASLQWLGVDNPNRFKLLTVAFDDASEANSPCLLYTSDAADERSSVDLGGRRIIKKKNREIVY